MDTSNTPRYSVLDAFRGLAIIWIVFFHVTSELRGYYWGPVAAILNPGVLGVQIFLVISGFGIAGALERTQASRQSAWSFFFQHAKRIYITYWLSLIFCDLVLPIAAGLISAVKNHSVSFLFWHHSFLEWVQIITLTKIFTARSWELSFTFFPLNGALWFIAILVQIYAAVSFCLLFGRKYTWALAVLFLASLSTALPAVKSLVPYGVFLPFFRDFYLGVVLFYLSKRQFPVRNGWAYGFSWLAFSIFAVIASRYYFSTFTFALITAMLFYLLRPLEQSLLKKGIFKFFVFIGSFSYSLFLLHIPLWIFIGAFARNWIPLPVHIATPLIVVPCAMFLSYIWYLFFEKPKSLRNIYGALKHPVITVTPWVKR